MTTVFVHALFHDERAAGKAVQALIDAHFMPETVSAVLRTQGHVEEDPAQYRTSTARGAALGGVLGAVGGGLVAIGTGWLAAGPLLAALQGGLLGAAAGAPTGALAGLGHWTDEAHLPRHIERGAILVGVSTEEAQVPRARQALEKVNPERIHVSTKDVAIAEANDGVLRD